MRVQAAFAIPLALLLGCAPVPHSNYTTAIQQVEFSAISDAERHASELGALLKAGTPEAQAIEQAKDAVAYDLKDPASVQFRNLRLRDFQGGKLLCGEINAKNSYGAYVGYAPFYAGVKGGFIKSRDSKSIHDAENAGLFAACAPAVPEGTTRRKCDAETIRRLITSGLNETQIDATCGRH